MGTEKKEKTEETQNLTDFQWDDEIEFFGVKVDKADVEDIKEEEKKTPEDKTDEKSDKDKKSEEEDKDKKSEKETETEETKFFEKTEDKEEPEEETEFFTTLAGELKENGVFQNVEIPEDEVIDQEKFIELQDTEVNARVEEALEGFMEELDDDGKAFLKFKKEGGKTEDFFKVVEKKSSLPTGDIEDESYQKKLVEYYSKVYEGLEDGGKLKRYAERYETKLKKAVEAEEKEAIKRQEQLRKQQEETDKKFVETLKSTLEETDKIKDFPITKKDKKDLVNYLTKPAVKVGKNRFLTGFQADMQEVTKDYEKLILLAKIIKDDFDISDIEREVTTKKVKDLKDKLERNKKNPKIKGSGSSTKKSLSDYF